MKEGMRRRAAAAATRYAVLAKQLAFRLALRTATFVGTDGVGVEVNVSDAGLPYQHYTTYLPLPVFRCLFLNARCL